MPRGPRKIFKHSLTEQFTIPRASEPVDRLILCSLETPMHGFLDSGIMKCLVQNERMGSIEALGKKKINRA